ncbi:MAG: protein kinase [Thermosynechococcaceae cyanobacterium]
MLGTVLAGRYKIIKILGEGGFGEAYLAEDQHLPDAQCCVVKKLKTDHHEAATLKVARRLFDSEAKMLHKLGHHDQIPRLLAHFEEAEGFYLVEEYVAGHSLDEELVPEQPLAEEAVIAMLRDILTGLAFVHQNQVIHRDIKPSNLIRRQVDNRVVLIDFGAVKQMTTQLINNHSRTPQTVLIGSPGYVPSEQFRGNPKLSSDIYAVGMIGIQALTGLNPAMGQLPEDEETGELVWQDRAQVSPEFATILEKMVLYDYRQRYSSAIAALETLQALIDTRKAAQIDLAWAETDIGAADEVPATIVNAPSSEPQIAASVGEVAPAIAIPAPIAAPVEETIPSKASASLETPPATASQNSATRYQGSAATAEPSKAVATVVTPAAAPAGSAPRPGAKKLKAAALGLFVLLLGGGAVGLASPHFEPLCQIFNNCSPTIRFQALYEDSTAAVKSAQTAATDAKNVEALQAAQMAMEDAIADLKSIPETIKIYPTAQKELPEYDKKLQALKTRVVAEQKAQEQFQQAETNAKTAEEKMKAVEKSATITTMEDAKKQWQASQANLKNIPQGSFMATEAQAKQQSQEEKVKTLQSKIDKLVAAEQQRQQAAAAAARRQQQAAAATQRQTATTRSTATRSTASQASTPSRSTSSTPRRSTSSSSTPQRSTSSSSAPRQSKPKAAPQKPLWGPPAGQEPLW